MGFRILMLSDFYPPIVGGMERHVQDLSVELAARGHEVAIVTLWHKGATFEVDRGVRVYFIRGSAQRLSWLYSDPGRRYAPPLPDPGVILALRRIIARERPDLVHAHSWLGYSFAPLKRCSGAKFVMTLHDYGLCCVNKSFVNRGAACEGPALSKCLECARDRYGPVTGALTVLANRVMGSIQRSAVDRFVTVSDSVARGTSLVGGSTRFTVVPNFISDKADGLETGAETYLSQLPEDPYLLFVGTLCSDKGIDVLLNAYVGLKNAPPLVLIGASRPDTPTEFPRNVTVLKDWPHGAVMRAWDRSIAALVPSRMPETFGIVIIEAMSAGRAVIASRVGAAPDLVVDGENGLLVPPGDPVALRLAIESLLSDPELRQRMGEAGRQKAAGYRASAVVPRVEQVYQELVQN